jgi:hypothetical protein
MAIFAKIGLNSKVIEVLSVHNNELKDSNGIEREELGVEFLTKLTGWAIWKQSSYNTFSGKYFNIDPITGVTTLAQDQSKAFRKNHASIGYTYDETRDAFIPPKPYPSWVLNETTCLWTSPVPYPNDGERYTWDESTKNWILVTQSS